MTIVTEESRAGLLLIQTRLLAGSHHSGHLISTFRIFTETLTLSDLEYLIPSMDLKTRTMENLINEVRIRPAIWNKNEKFHNDIKYVDKLWSEVCDKVDIPSKEKIALSKRKGPSNCSNSNIQ